MEEKPDNLRKELAKNFFESYDRQLLDAFRASKVRTAKTSRLGSPRSQPPQKESPKSIGFSELEEAIADIDSFLSQNQEPKPISNPEEPPASES
ncbi:MAG: hypothetical protein HC825_01120 [Oscillatoriales cyanobacterium RM1_1_9]|nr:hypothetical protein [Oscillatoriales cyanobacterium SM2_3_0]NJO70682.1 hypothetical protein [Oscillatoriales cyanobacterium RM1_1_9]